MVTSYSCSLENENLQLDTEIDFRRFSVTRTALLLHPSDIASLQPRFRVYSSTTFFSSKYAALSKVYLPVLALLPKISHHHLSSF